MCKVLEDVIIKEGRFQVVTGPISDKLKDLAERIAKKMPANFEGQISVGYLDNGEGFAWLDNEPIDFDEVVENAMAA